MVICAYALVWVLPSFFTDRVTAQEKEIILSLWHVDSFEGGKGSRAAFLNRIATAFEKSEKVTFLVSAKTAEGVKDAFQKGERPDLLSFGGYLDLSGVNAEAECWCMGKYALYSMGQTDESPTPQNTVISNGGLNFPAVAAALEGLRGEFAQEEALTAYTKFLNGKYTYLLGTQRDACRFQSRGAEVAVKPLNAFTDLKQYIAVVNEENREVCQRFIGYLLSEESQKLLTAIGMLSEKYDIYAPDQALQNALEEVGCRYSVSPYLSAEAAKQLKSVADRVLQGENAEVLKKFLKGG